MAKEQKKAAARNPAEDMHRPAVPAVRDPRSAVAVGGGGTPPSAALKDEDSGLGLSNRREDVVLPIMSVLQPLSPYCLDGDEKQIKGARAGMILLKNEMDPLIEGKEGLMVQPILMYLEWQRWVPRDAGGGLVDRWTVPDGESSEKHRPKEARLYVTEGKKGKKKQRWIIDGDDVFLARVFLVNVYREDGLPLAYIISLSSTGHSVGRMWETMQKKKRLPDGREANAFSCLYHMTTLSRKNDAGTWYSFNPRDIIEDGKFAGWANDAQYKAGKDLYVAFMGGAVRAGVPDDETVVSSNSGDEPDDGEV